MARGIPVPPVIPEGSKAFTICVPDDPFFYGVVMGALKVTTFNYYWQGSSADIEAVTDRMKTMYYTYQDQDGCMDCAQVADCIENDAATQEAIANAIRTSTSIQDALRDAYDEFQRGKDMPPDVTGQDVTGANPGCNLDKLWGWIIAGVNEMDTNNRDSQQVFETLSNQWERISTLVAAIPGVGVLPVDEIIQYAQGLWSDDLIDAYEANDTLTYRRQIACDLFCMARDNGCALTLDMMLNYFLERIAYSGLQTVGNIVGYLIGGTWSGTQINDTFYIAQLVFLKFGNAFFKLIGIKPIEIMFQLGEPSDDWTLLCDCPEDWESYVDFELSDYGFAAPAIGTYTAAVGFEDTYQAVGGGYRGLYASLTFAAPALINYGELVFEYTAGTLVSSGDNTAAIINEAAGYLLQIVTPTVPVSPEVGTVAQTFNEITVGLVCGIGGGGVPNDPGGTCILKALRLRGTGTKPPELP